MPIIRVEMLAGRSIEQKRNLAAKLTDSFVETCDVKKEAVSVIITEVEADNWAIGSQLVSDRGK